MIKQYGISDVKTSSSEMERHLENIRLRGYTILRKILSKEECDFYAKKAEDIYTIQVNEFGIENLKSISEENVVRCPLLYDENFVRLITVDSIIQILKALFQNQFILHLQNVIINRPNSEHHQTSWHRDIPYQEYTTSKPLSINVFYCLSPFSSKTGATKILPYSHLFEKFPSIDFAEENSIYVEADPGDVVIFNSWLYHRASVNSSDIIRYGINHVFTLPILKQQINLPEAFNGKWLDDPFLGVILGYTFEPPKSVLDYRFKKLKNKKNEY